MEKSQFSVFGDREGLENELKTLRARVDKIERWQGYYVAIACGVGLVVGFAAALEVVGK